jgi:hypothetical protein
LPILTTFGPVSAAVYSERRKRISKTVLILGAGASASAGAPLMWNFLDEAERLRDSNAVADSSNEFNLVFKALAALKQTLSILNQFSQLLKWRSY